MIQEQSKNEKVIADTSRMYKLGHPKPHKYPKAVLRKTVIAQVTNQKRTKCIHKLIKAALRNGPNISLERFGNFVGPDQ